MILIAFFFHNDLDCDVGIMAILWHAYFYKNKDELLLI